MGWIGNRWGIACSCLHSLVRFLSNFGFEMDSICRNCLFHSCIFSFFAIRTNQFFSILSLKNINSFKIISFRGISFHFNQISSDSECEIDHQKSQKILKFSEKLWKWSWISQKYSILGEMEPHQPCWSSIKQLYSLIVVWIYISTKQNTIKCTSKFPSRILC